MHGANSNSSLLVRAGTDLSSSACLMRVGIE